MCWHLCAQWASDCALRLALRCGVPNAATTCTVESSLGLDSCHETRCDLLGEIVIFAENVGKNRITKLKSDLLWGVWSSVCDLGLFLRSLTSLCFVHLNLCSVAGSLSTFHFLAWLV